MVDHVPRTEYNCCLLQVPTQCLVQQELHFWSSEYVMLGSLFRPNALIRVVMIPQLFIIVCELSHDDDDLRINASAQKQHSLILQEQNPDSGLAANLGDTLTCNDVMINASIAFGRSDCYVPNMSDSNRATRGKLRFLHCGCHLSGCRYKARMSKSAS